MRSTMLKKIVIVRFSTFLRRSAQTGVYAMKPVIDIDSLRTEHESDEQWEVRRSFMVEHKDDFEERELIVLAQLFTNIEFLGCRYPPVTMKRIAALSEKVSANYRESRKNKLKRTFVEASDAAEQKAKRTFTK